MKRCQEEIQESSLFRGVYRLFVEKHTFEMTGACLLENIQCTQPYAKEALEAFSFNVWKHLRERERTNDFRCVWWKSLSIKNKRNENGKDYTQNTCVLLLMPTKESQRYPKVVCLSLESPAYFNKKTTEALAYTACKALNLPDTALECMFCERKNNNEGRIVFSPFGKGTLKRCGYANLPLSAAAHNTLFPETVEAPPSIPFNEKNKQSKIIHGRKQCREVEGCAGTGKSFTLLWYAAKAYQRTHLPVLILVRTNTLVSFFKRTYEATLRDDVGGDFTLPEGNIAVMTVDQFLCLHHSYIRSGASCRLEKWMDKTKRNKTCALCKQDLLETIFAPDSVVNASQTYGCVLVDEVQSLEPDKRKACYLTTQRTNPFREFYIFGDARQALQEDAIGADEEGNSKGKTIRAPATGFGRQIVLKKDYRCTKSALKDVQELFRKRFEGQGIDIEEYQSEMVTKEAPAQATFEVIAPYKCEPTELRHPNCHKQIKEMLDELLNAGGNTRNDILVLCNAKEVLKVVFGAVSDWAKAHNVTFRYTHTEHGKDRKEERLQFWNTPKTVWLTTIDCAQGWTFEKVLFLYDVSLRTNQANALCYTAITRAKSMLRILVDKSQLAQ